VIRLETVPYGRVVLINTRASQGGALRLCHGKTHRRPARCRAQTAQRWGVGGDGHGRQSRSWQLTQAHMRRSRWNGLCIRLKNMRCHVEATGSRCAFLRIGSLGKRQRIAKRILAIRWPQHRSHRRDRRLWRNHNVLQLRRQMG
jgi:hypothetical protein